MKDKLFTGITLVLVGIIVFSAWKIWEGFSEYKSGEDAYEELSTNISLPSTQPMGSSEDKDGEAGPIIEEADWPVVDFASLREMNPDMIGWVYIEDTKINYPIVQGSDNSYYMEYLFTKEANNSGAIFLDCKNNPDLTDRHSVIYGHHMKNGAMFSGLMDYKEQTFYDQHSTIMLLMPEKNYRLELFSGYVAAADSDAWLLDFSATDFTTWLSAAVAKSCFKSSVTPTSQDRIVTLSTCSYEFDDARFVLHGILVEI